MTEVNDQGMANVRSMDLIYIWICFVSDFTYAQCVMGM